MPVRETELKVAVMAERGGSGQAGRTLTFPSAPHGSEVHETSPERARVMADAASLVTRVRALTGADEPTALPDPAGPNATTETLERASLALFAAVGDASAEPTPERMSEISELLGGLHDVRRRLRDDGLSRRLHGLARVQGALGRLHAARTVGKLLEIAPGEACRSGGFDRAVIFRVDGPELVAVAAHAEHDPRSVEVLLHELRSAPPPLNALPAESEMLRRRTAAIVDAASSTATPLLAALRDSYVGAPVVSEHRVLGFIHADRGRSQRPIDAVDRYVLQSFCEGFARALEHATLLERLRSQQHHLRRTLVAAEASIDALASQDIDMIGSTDGNTPPFNGHVVAFPSPPWDLETPLTNREREVLVLMASGATNAKIASQLVVSQATVKAHVTNILRKLQAANRAEAVSHYMRMRHPAVG
jgi:LuxR family transcriptional regulator, regulator of acetate metabolism